MLTALVLINMAFLLVDMLVTDPNCPMYGDVELIQECIAESLAYDFQRGWTAGFQIMELSFLTVFAVDICLRLYAYGTSYFKELLNVLDALIVFGLLIFQVLIFTVLAEVMDGGNFSFLRIVRLVRLVRLFVVMNKVQKAQRAYKKAKYLKLGSPVERVMELLGEMKRKIEDNDKDKGGEDVAHISWIMHLIASDKLYTIDIRAAGGGNLSSEMTAWLEDNLGMKKDMEAEAEEGDEATNLATAAGVKRQETKMMPGGDSAGAKELGKLDEVLTLPEMGYYLHPNGDGALSSRLHEWDIDVFDLAAKSKGYHLVASVHQLLEDHGLIAKVRLSKHRLLNFLHRIQDGYIPENPYHNSVHALDVALNTNYFCGSDEMCIVAERIAS